MVVTMLVMTRSENVHVGINIHIRTRKRLVTKQAMRRPRIVEMNSITCAECEEATVCYTAHDHRKL